MDNDLDTYKLELKKRGIIDDNDRIIRWSKKQKDQHFILQCIVKNFDAGHKYSEKEVNEIIQKFILFNDHVLIRRELIEKFYLKRTPDCKVYWREN